MNPKNGRFFHVGPILLVLHSTSASDAIRCGAFTMRRNTESNLGYFQTLLKVLQISAKSGRLTPTKRINYDYSSNQRTKNGYSFVS